MNLSNTDTFQKMTLTKKLQTIDFISPTQSFNPEEAIKHGVDKAVVLSYFRLLIAEHKMKNENIMDGCTWFYQSHQDFEKTFPFWHPHKISGVLRVMEKKKLIKCHVVLGADNEKEKWYTITT